MSRQGLSTRLLRLQCLRRDALTVERFRVRCTYTAFARGGQCICARSAPGSTDASLEGCDRHHYDRPRLRKGAFYAHNLFFTVPQRVRRRVARHRSCRSCVRASRSLAAPCRQKRRARQCRYRAARAVQPACARGRHNASGAGPQARRSLRPPAPPPRTRVRRGALPRAQSAPRTPREGGAGLRGLASWRAGRALARMPRARRRGYPP
mmetsp:Transcript_12539/g.21030  ORF Transcript_12539/g.21030 Transcript_12539/m.21030 type:complete len:208 (-) Transcript_12539:987-1610(-)